LLFHNFRWSVRRWYIIISIETMLQAIPESGWCMLCYLEVLKYGCCK
jgi:hypothetical protein